MSAWWIVAVGAVGVGLVVAALAARRGRIAVSAVASDAAAMGALRADAAALRSEAGALRERLEARRAGADHDPGSR